MSDPKVSFLICPNCRQHFELNTDEKKCKKCNVPLMDDKSFLQYKINKNKQKKAKEERVNIISAAVFFSIAIIAIFTFIVIIAQKSNEPETFVDDKRCWFCSRIIRADGRNIHGTPTDSSGRTIKCEYCGHNNVIVE